MPQCLSPLHSPGSSPCRQGRRCDHWGRLGWVPSWAGVGSPPYSSCPPQVFSAWLFLPEVFSLTCCLFLPFLCLQYLAQPLSSFLQDFTRLAEEKWVHRSGRREGKLSESIYPVPGYMDRGAGQFGSESNRSNSVPQPGPYSSDMH